MSFLSFFSNLFCGGKDELIADLKAQVELLQQQKSVLSKNYVSCLSDKSEIILNCSKDNQYLSLRVLELTQILANTIMLPALPLSGEYTAVEPDALPEIYGYDMVRADLVYYAFPKDVWENILPLIQAEVKKVLQSWVKDVGDCDDWALVMNAFLVAAIKRTGLKHQGAFTIAWSNSHAYNLYVDDSKRIWIYEPQNGKTVGLLKSGVAPYDTKKIWFVGEKT